MAKITKRVVDRLRPDPDGKNERFVWDGELRGFGLRMMPTGAASYLVQYRTSHGRTRRLAIGKVGTLTPEAARKLARARLSEAAEGKDPSAARRQLRNALTVTELCDTYIAEAASWVKPSTLAMDKSRIESHVKPLLGRRAVATLTLDDLQRFQSDISIGKTARPAKVDEYGKRKGRGGTTRGGKGVATRTLGMLGTILEFARRRKVIAENPARGVERIPEGKQQRFLSSVELAEFGKAMRTAVVAGENPVGLAAIRFILLTGLRRMEALGLRKPWLDKSVQCIRFPDTKSGAQVRAIGTAALDAVDELITDKDSEWLFPAAHGDGHLVGLPKLLARICKAAKLDGVTLHVLRHTFASVAAELGYSQFVIAGLLGHALPGVTARYAHMPDAALVIAADRISRRVQEVLEGKAANKEKTPSRRSDSADIIELGKRRHKGSGSRTTAA